MIKGFKEFILRGNVVELAVAVAIGTAFTTLVKTVLDNFVQPIIAAFPGAKSNGWGFSLRGDELEQATFINISAIINAIIVFIMTAAAIYFLIVAPMNAITERRKRGEPTPEVEKSDEVKLLEEIRDALRK